MTPIEIRAAVAASQELTDMNVAGNYQGIADALSVGLTKVQTLLLSERGILERYPDGPIAADGVLVKLETFAASAHPLAGVVRRAIKFLGMSDGLDVGSAATQSLLTQLGAGGVLTVDEAAKLAALAIVPSRISWQEVASAMEVV